MHSFVLCSMCYICLAKVGDEEEEEEEEGKKRE
jgi:hypothetical protein